MNDAWRTVVSVKNDAAIVVSAYIIKNTALDHAKIQSFGSRLARITMMISGTG